MKAALTLAEILTAVALAANVDPRVQQATIDTIDQYLPPAAICNRLQHGRQSYAVAASSPYGNPDINFQTTPKMAAYQSVMSADGGELQCHARSRCADRREQFAWDSDSIYKNCGWLGWNIVTPSSDAFTITAVTSGSKLQI